MNIPDNDALLDEQKSFAEQPEAVRNALTEVYKSFPKEKLALVRDELKARVGRDETLDAKGYELGEERQRLFHRRRALNVVNAERPAAGGELFVKGDKTGLRNARLFELAERYLRELYSEEEIARLESDAGYLEAEKAKVAEGFADVERRIAENEQRIEEKREKDRAAIDRARLSTLLPRMDGSLLYNGIVIMAGPQQAASETLNNRGIKGVIYVGETDGRAFVVFDGNNVNIVETYYSLFTFSQRIQGQLKLYICRLLNTSPSSPMSHLYVKPTFRRRRFYALVSFFAPERPFQIIDAP